MINNDDKHSSDECPNPGIEEDAGGVVVVVPSSDQQGLHLLQAPEEGSLYISVDVLKEIKIFVPTEKKEKLSKLNSK